VRITSFVIFLLNEDVRFMSLIMVVFIDGSTSRFVFSRIEQSLNKMISFATSSCSNTLQKTYHSVEERDLLPFRSSLLRIA